MWSGVFTASFFKGFKPTRFIFGCACVVVIVHFLEKLLY